MTYSEAEILKEVSAVEPDLPTFNKLEIEKELLERLEKLVNQLENTVNKI